LSGVQFWPRRLDPKERTTDLAKVS
jgi:hypothetical protein